MAAPRGTLRRGGGRPKGAVNKLPMQLKEMIETALSELGGTDYLIKQGRKNPKVFLALVGKLIPRDLNISAEVRHTLSDMILAAQQAKPPADPPSIQ